MRELILKGVRQNNLRNIDLNIPLGKSVVVTGPSGSGKSSLAFETIYAEGQRRYMQSLSTYAKQFLEKFRAPDADKIENIPPTIALEQINPVRNSRATVGTSTEIYDYLRLLFEKLGTEYCDKCNIPMEHLSFVEIGERIVKDFSDQTVLISFTEVLPIDKNSGAELLAERLKAGYSRLVLGKTLWRVEDLIKSGPPSAKPVEWIIDRLTIPSLEQFDSIRSRLMEGLGEGMELGRGVVNILSEKEKEYTLAADFTAQNRCPKCRQTSAPKTATSFSFNSPLGACTTCNGFGNRLELDEDKVIPNANLSLAQGAVDPFTKPSLNHWQKKLLAYCKENRIDTGLPYRELPVASKKQIFEGSKKFKGVKGVFSLMEKDKYKMQVRVFLSRYQSAFTCPECLGARLSGAPLRVKIGEKNIAELSDLTLEKLDVFFKQLPLKPVQREIAADILRQLDTRLEYLNTVGLGYLTLSRLSRSLSGGEYQRILLATQLSQGLTDTMYVLDEPSIGLHPKDTKQLVQVLNKLRKQGNSLVVVEHDPELIEWGEHVVDMGPGAGHRGGNVVFAGSAERFRLSDTSTADAIRTWKEECRSALMRTQRELPSQFLEIRGAAGNNLKGINVAIPLNRLVTITGVSGSGKSTLIVDTLYNALSKIFFSQSEKIAKFESISGFEHLSAVELIDQSAIGKSSRSNPITFIKAYDEIRSLFASTREAAAKRLTPGHFSFNVSGGRCEECEGEGRVRVDMVFMEDIWIPCQVCDEKRFKKSILAVRYKGRNIDDVLRMTVDEAYDFFASSSSLRAKLAVLHEVGLGYLQLGQPGFTLSGGEAQRLKIARELAAGPVKRPRTLFIFDEPTTGLHFGEVSRLIGVLKRLLSGGHSVIVIEHNVQMVCASEYVIDLGPDGGIHGGDVVAVGTPKELALNKLPHTGLYLSEFLALNEL